MPKQVTTFTSDLPGAGTDAAVFIEMAGQGGSSGPQELVPTASSPAAAGGSGGGAACATGGGSGGGFAGGSGSGSGVSGGAFAAGGVGVFEISSACDLGELSSLAVWREGGGAGWHLARAEVRHTATGQVRCL